MRTMLKSKIHRAHVTETDINYEGSITIDRKLMEEADILPYEQVHGLNINNGARFTSYTIGGEKARNFIPELVYVDANNVITETKRAVESISF